MQTAHVKELLAQGFTPEDILVDGETAGKLVGVSKKTLDRWRRNGSGDFPAPILLGTRSLKQLGPTAMGNKRESQLVRYRLSAIRDWMDGLEKEAKEGGEEEAKA